MRFDGILFDLDGTLWDSCAAVAASWNLSLLERWGIDGGLTADDARGIMGLTVDGVARRIFARYGGDAGEMCLACLADECGYIASHGAAIFPGVPGMLEELAGKAPLFIVSNCQRGYIEAFLDCSGLGGFISAHECEGSTGLSKGGNIRLLTRRFDLRSPVYVGDTVTDEAGAAEAGCPFVHAAYGFGTARMPMGSIAAPAELPRLLEAL